MAELVNENSGLLGLSGVSADMQDLLAHEHDNPAAAEAIAVFCYQVRKYIGAFAAALDGLDTLVFAGGIGENAAPVRWRICEGLSFLGVSLDPAANNRNANVISQSARWHRISRTSHFPGAGGRSVAAASVARRSGVAAMTAIGSRSPKKAA